MNWKQLDKKEDQGEKNYLSTFLRITLGRKVSNGVTISLLNKAIPLNFNIVSKLTDLFITNHSVEMLTISSFLFINQRQKRNKNF